MILTTKQSSLTLPAKKAKKINKPGRSYLKLLRYSPELLYILRIATVSAEGSWIDLNYKNCCGFQRFI
jgi:hypothetical protein